MRHSPPSRPRDCDRAALTPFTAAIVLMFVASLSACGETDAPSVASGATPADGVGASSTRLPSQSGTQIPVLNPVAAGTHRIEPGNPRPIVQAGSPAEAAPADPSIRMLAAASTTAPPSPAAHAPGIVVIPGSPARPGTIPAGLQSRR